MHWLLKARNGLGSSCTYEETEMKASSSEYSQLRILLSCCWGGGEEKKEDMVIGDSNYSL